MKLTEAKLKKMKLEYTPVTEYGDPSMPLKILYGVEEFGTDDEFLLPEMSDGLRQAPNGQIYRFTENGWATYLFDGVWKRPDGGCFEEGSDEITFPWEE